MVQMPEDVEAIRAVERIKILVDLDKTWTPTWTMTWKTMMNMVANTTWA